MTRVDSLDGMRGIAALWVFIGHTMILTGLRVPLLSWPGFGVDLFILLSGFLMVYQYNQRHLREDWENPRTWSSFWLRRYFRLSPLYYLVLLVGLAAGAWLYADRMAIDAFLGAKAQDPDRYLDFTPVNIFLHVTYLFSFIPAYSFRTPLPDWSLGLEAQFYAAFPFLILAMRKFGWWATAIAGAFAGTAITQGLKAAGIEFPGFTFLPLLLHVFLAGMLVGAQLPEGRWTEFLRFALVVVLIALPGAEEFKAINIVVRVVLAAGFFAVVRLPHFSGIKVASAVLASRPFVWLGELSYGTYLMHLLIVQPVAAWTIGALSPGVAPVVRFAIAMTISLPIVYLLAFAGYMFVEKPGQQLGRTVIGRMFRGNGGRQTVAEEIAAP